ncbi:hypothetical protein GQX59_08745 [Brachyspira hyodysenteriae]|uniref:hypothetical protein n=1 Tax=Brachyspira hyodysenteriae TaxID=159 RepID=UPI00063D9561|nr:hypothetical protein [Brachyspira hyodysenteriae]KLI13786.1 hypothetical protein SU45_12040 [Brachyspira hyodysenteriae]KLI59672.1 hypothetical protein SZ46_08450 [Brachyspira hyodysenteriae]QTM11511.1 hypothetical protein GQX59_08745 [Brachyspira hyodysenteriae]
MKKILLTFTLLFAFSFSVYGQKLIASITEGEVTVQQYDNKFNLVHNTFGSIEISNDELSIVAKGARTDSYLLFYIKGNDINIICYKKYFDLKPIIYFLLNENRNEQYDSQKVIGDNEIYSFQLPKKHFDDLKNTNTLLVIPTSKNQDGYNIYVLIKLLKVYEKQIKDYSIYQKYLK